MQHAVSRLAPTLSAAALSLVLAPAALAQAPVDLHSWSAESYPAVSGFGAGVWTVAADGSSVFQSVNGQPTLFYSDFNVFNTEIEGKIVVSGGDDDYMGFVLGFDPGDSTNLGADYLLVDWKAGTQSFDFGTPSCTPSSVAPRGLAVSRVTGIPTADEFWGHLNFDSVCSDLASGVEELQRANTLGATGWSGGVSYTFRFVFDSTQLQVYVNDVLELDISGSFANGRMGFYNFSQAAVTYSAFTLDCPSLAENYGDGWPGTLGVPALTASADPVLGTTIQLHAGNAYGGETVGCLFIGLAPAALPTPYDGVVLVAITGLVSLHPLPIGGTDLAFTIPSDIAYCGIDLYAQLVHGDPGATQGLAFSQGLHMILGQ